MSKVDASKFGSAAPKLEPYDLEEDTAVLTLDKYEEVWVDDKNVTEGPNKGKRLSATLRFRETGDKVLWLNKGMVETLVEQLGDDSEKWLGQKIPVEKHVAKFGNDKFPKVRVVPSEEWDGIFKEAGIRRPKVTPGAKK